MLWRLCCLNPGLSSDDLRKTRCLDILGTGTAHIEARVCERQSRTYGDLLLGHSAERYDDEANQIDFR